MSPAAPFLAAIREAPEDDAPRLIYADWLDEHGEPERAEFIRVQCKLERRKTKVLRQREAELFAAHHDKFAGPLAAPGLQFRFNRGFIIAFEHTGIFAGSSGRLKVVLRFFSDGLVIGATGRNREDTIRNFDREDRYLPYGTYDLTAFESPATIRFTCASAFVGEEIEFSGVIEGGYLNPESHSLVNGRPLRCRLAHYDIPDFDSFSESP